MRKLEIIAVTQALPETEALPKNDANRLVHTEIQLSRRGKAIETRSPERATIVHQSRSFPLSPASERSR